MQSLEQGDEEGGTTTNTNHAYTYESKAVLVYVYRR